MKVLNMVIPIPMRFYSIVSNSSVASCIKLLKGVRHQVKYDAMNEVKLDITLYLYYVIIYLNRYHIIQICGRTRATGVLCSNDGFKGGNLTAAFVTKSFAEQNSQNAYIL